MFSQILFWCLTALRSYFFQFSLICLSLSLSLFYFCKLSFYFPCSLFKIPLEAKFLRLSCRFFWILTQCCPAPGSPLLLCADWEIAKSSVPGGRPWRALLDIFLVLGTCHLAVCALELPREEVA